MRYRDYKSLYDARNYVPRYGDPYDPFLAGVASYFIPGLGQTVCGEVGRGIGFFLGTELMMAGTIVSIALTPGELDVSYYGEQTVIRKPTTGDHLRNLTMIAGTCARYVWNICDAVKVAKIKNLYARDLRARMATPEMSLEPYINSAPAAAGSQLVGGLALRVNL